ncbi:zf-HC2 domain-containing protein [Microbispora sp. RL4-1S]|uniref:Zf-HC2 domain-containing protein n=1 Tax=Microbispora oryzae TaxID=2806554 RepID=A0A941AI03_9ACTN|nr:zf-HC2 domain-containing protein [Microbispora oryzae]MBP2704665.1 zf-HC2 domain-containing protein [Microbispora oryzae]
MTRDTHYDVEILAELAEGLLDDTTARRVREHLAVCDPCGESLADLAAVREVLAAVPTPAMPLGVAMRIDRALAAEAPDWDRMMRDAPWANSPWTDEPGLADAPAPDDAREIAPVPASVPAPVPGELREIAAEPAPAPFGVVADDGTIVPARRGGGRSGAGRRGRASRRRLWALPAAAAAAAAVIVGGTGLATNLLSDGGAAQSSLLGSGAAGSATPTKTHQKAVNYSISASGHNYTSRELRGPLLGYFGVAPGSGTNDDQDLDTCVKRLSAQLDRTPIGVDKALYNGQEATVMAFWEDKKINAVRVVVVDDECQPLRQDDLATWR